MGIQALTVLLALASAVCFATNSVCQHHDINRTMVGRGMRLRTAVHLVSQPVWLFGSAAGLTAVLLQALALTVGPVSLVEPLLVNALVFALPATALVRRRRPQAVEWAWAVAVLAGLVLFLVAANPTSIGPGRVRELIMVIATLMLTVLIVVLAVLARRRPRYRAALLGAASGIGYGIAGALGKYCLLQLQSGPLYVLAHWPVWALPVVAVSSVVITQTAFRAGPLAASLPPLTVLQPLVAVFLGVAALGETVSYSISAVTTEIFGGALLVAATIGLARHTSASR